MSDPKRATLITAGAPKSAKNKVNKTVRLTINLDESNESKYPELNYKELVNTEERKKRVENGKRETAGLDPFSESNEDVERIARKLEQKYGGKSAYGRKSRSKHDDFADIGAGYDENDSFIDNTDGYDEMIPPECDTLYGGFYINCGSLEFKNVSTNQEAASDGEAGGQRRNKRRISSSSSEEESSESSSESSRDVKDPKAIANGDIDSHKTEHRKKKIKKADKKKAKKVRRTDSSAATSGKQTSDDNAHGDGESADSRTSQSDSLTSKPAPSSENAITSDSSRDIETKMDMKLPSDVLEVVEALEDAVSKYLVEHPNATSKDLVSCSEEYINRLERVLSGNSMNTRRVATRLSRVLRLPRASLLPMLTVKETPATQIFTTTAQSSSTTATATTVPSTTAATTTAPSTTTATVTVTSSKRKANDHIEAFDPDTLTEEEREAKIVETLQRLQALIEERKPGMITNYNAECERVQEERKKLQIASTDGKQVEKRLPKRRFPWCARSRALLCTLATLAHAGSAAQLLQARALPLFPAGFVRMPTLLRQADLNKEIKVTGLKRQRLGSASLPNPPTTQLVNQLASLPATPVSPIPEPIQFPSSLTVTTAVKPSDKPEVAISTEEKSYKKTSIFGSIINTFSLNKDLIIEKPDRKDTETKKEDLYIPPNNIGSITITAVPNNPTKPDKKPNNIQVSSEKPTGLIRVKSPAALNEMVKKDKQKKPEKPVEKRVQSPLHVDTSYQPNKKDPSPKKKEEIPQKQIENMRVAENNIPRPALVPVHHSPTFAKPDKRPPEIKKKKEVIILSDVDPLSDQQEPLAVDDSSSDVEVVEDTRTETSELKANKSEQKANKSELKANKSELKANKSELKVDKSVSVPSKDRNVDVNRKVSVKCKEKDKREEEVSNDDFCNIMRNIREMEHSQEPAKFNSNSFGGVITNAKHERSSNLSSFPKSSVFGERDKDKLTERTSLNKMDGCNGMSG